MPGPEQGTVQVFALNDSGAASLATTGMEMSWLDDPWALGPGRVWMRPRQPFLPEEPATPLMRLAGAADFGNGHQRGAPFDEYLFINADLAIHLWRLPAGEWIGLDARTLLHRERRGDRRKRAPRPRWPRRVRSFQTLVVQPR